MSDRKAVIKNADMSDEMQQDAVDCAMQAMEKYNIEKDIAAYVKKVNVNDILKGIFQEYFSSSVCSNNSMKCCNSCRNLTRSTIPHGTALSGGTLAAT